MKKSNTGVKLLIVAAFIVGMVAGFLARHYLPAVLTGVVYAYINILAFLIQLIVSILVVLIGVFVFHIGKNR